MTLKVGINGFGTIGKRVADAVSKQDDMKLIGVTKMSPDFEAKSALEHGYKLFIANAVKEKSFKELGFETSGTLIELLKQIDIIVDATPEGTGAENKKKFYIPKNISAVFQGGEEAGVAELSFVAQCNYSSAFGKKYVRCVSCNTTGLSRVLNSLNENFKIGKVRATLIRRAVDPKEVKKGPINAIVPELEVPSHHGPDLNTVLPNIDIVTCALKVPTTLMHVHSLMIELKENTSEDKVISALEKTPRVKLIDSKLGLKSTAEIIEYARDMGRNRYDLYENIIWKDSIHIKNNELYLMQAIHQEAIVVPENVDALRAVAKLEKEPLKSIRKTDKSLGISL